MLQYLIVCPLVFLAGFVDSIAGGGGLISLPAYIIAGVPAHYALGTNKISSTLGTRYRHMAVSEARISQRQATDLDGAVRLPGSHCGFPTLDPVFLLW